MSWFDLLSNASRRLLHLTRDAKQTTEPSKCVEIWQLTIWMDFWMEILAAILMNILATTLMDVKNCYMYPKQTKNSSKNG